MRYSEWQKKKIESRELPVEIDINEWEYALSWALYHNCDRDGNPEKHGGKLCANCQLYGKIISAIREHNEKEIDKEGYYKQST